MKLTSIFLGSVGLSQSEANHTANIAKEVAASIGSEISGMSLFKKTLHDKFGKVPYNNVTVVTDLQRKCLEEGKIYALSAWLREGIKAKAAILEGIKHADLDTLGFSVGTGPDRPVLNALPVEAEMIEQLSIPERTEYLSVESQAAHIGKKIHPGGIIPLWKDQLAKTPPVSFIQGEKDYMRVEAERIINPTEVDDLFYALQKEHREAESKLNYYKAKLHNMFNAETVRVQGLNSRLTQEWNTRMSTWRGQFEVACQQAEASRATLMKEASDLKVIVPHDLQKTLDYVQTFSRKQGIVIAVAGAEGYKPGTPAFILQDVIPIRGQE